VSLSKNAAKSCHVYYIVGSTGVVVVSFAGTDTTSVANWIDDLDEVKTPWPLEGCQVRRKWEGGREREREGSI